MDDEIEPTPAQLLAALDASELVEQVSALTEQQRGDLLERVALLVGANRTLGVDEFRSELTDILNSGPTFHAVLHGGQFDGQVMELDPEDFDAEVVCAAVEQREGEPAGGEQGEWERGEGERAEGERAEGEQTEGERAEGDAEHAVRASDVLNSLYRLRDGEPAPGSTVHYEFGGLVAAENTEAPRHRR